MKGARHLLAALHGSDDAGCDEFQEAVSPPTRNPGLSQPSGAMLSAYLE
jgi:hypothetical protein